MLIVPKIHKEEGLLCKVKKMVQTLDRNYRFKKKVIEIKAFKILVSFRGINMLTKFRLCEVKYTYYFVGGNLSKSRNGVHNIK